LETLPRPRSAKKSMERSDLNSCPKRAARRRMILFSVNPLLRQSL
jgi:hypothetical protein